MARRPQQVAECNCNKCRSPPRPPPSLGGWAPPVSALYGCVQQTKQMVITSTRCQLSFTRAQSRQVEEAESVESANALQTKNRVEVGSADRKVVGRDWMMWLKIWN